MRDIPARCRRRGVEVVGGQFELRQLGPHGVGALDAHRREHDLAFAHFYIEVLGRTDGIHRALWQRELVLGRQLGKHRKPR